MATRTLTEQESRRLFSVLGERDKNKLLSWHEVQRFEQDNPYILTSYRPLTNSYLGCLRSLFAIHNQTVNVWSHLLGSIIYAVAGLYLWHSLASRYDTFSTSDIIVFGCYFGSVVLCLGLSVGFHLFANHSHNIHNRHLFLDFLGILGLIVGSWIPGIYYGFYCDDASARFYWSLICTITAACAIVIIIPTFRQQHWKPIRTALFVALGLSGVLPMLYTARNFGIGQAHRQMGWGYFCLEGIFYTSGVLFYAVKIPERFWPGSFDIVGSSHQIFHVTVLCGAAAHLTGILQAFNYNHNPETRLCGVLSSPIWL